MDSNIKRSIILDNFNNPQNKGLKHNKKAIKINANNQSCIDEIDLELIIEDNTIKDLSFDGEACAICTSSTSIMIKTILGKKVSEALKIIDEFIKMIKEEEFDKDLIEQAIVFEDIIKQPNRIKCATLSWINLKQALETSLTKN